MVPPPARTATAAPDHRVRCLACQRPSAQCLCPHLAAVDNRTEVLILQHPKERRHAFNTARLTRLSLARAELVVGHAPELAADTALAERLAGAGLLYPGPGARDLATLAPDEHPARLVVLDGTWYHARNMLRDVPALGQLPRFALPDGLVSGFRIRRQPRAECLSTIEAVHAALACLEPGAPGLDAMLRPFHEMQRLHLASSTHDAPRTRLRPRPTRRPPARALDPRDPALVVVYVELSPWTSRSAPRGIVAFAALRPADGAGFHCVLEDAVPVAPHWPAMALGPALAHGAPWAPERLRATWEVFLRPDDTVAAWSIGSLGVLADHLGPPPHALDLRRLYRARRPHRGNLDEIVAAEGLTAPAPPRATRAQLRLANSVRIVELLGSGGRP